jgi:hypothetical protein
MRWWLLLLVLLAVTATEAQIYQGCNISVVETIESATGFYGGDFYALVLTFNDTVSLSLTSTSSVAWTRVRQRMRLFTSRHPSHDILLAREPSLNRIAPFSPYLLSGNSLRVEMGLTLNAGETVTLRYFQPPIAPTVDLLAGGKSVPSFECVAVMPNVTRLIGQVTVANPVEYDEPAVTYETVVISFSRPVVSCSTGGNVTVSDLRYYPPTGTSAGSPLSTICTGLEPFYDQRAWKCTGPKVPFLASAIEYNDNGFEFKVVAPIKAVSVCDREYNTTVGQDLKYSIVTSIAPSLELATIRMWWMTASWVIDTGVFPLQVIAAYPYTGVYVPLNGSETTLFYQGGPDYSSQIMWFPPKILTMSFNQAGQTILNEGYRIVSSPLDINMTLSMAQFDYCSDGSFPPVVVTAIWQVLADNGLIIHYAVSYTPHPSYWSRFKPVLIASSIDPESNLIDSASALSGFNSWFVPGLTHFRTDLWGYLDGTYFDSEGPGEVYVYSWPMNVTTQWTIKLVSAGFFAPSTIRLTFNNSLQLRAFQLDHLHYSCGNVTQYSLSATEVSVVDIQVAGGLCFNASLTLDFNLAWSSSEWFSVPQVFQSIANESLVLFNATLFNRELGYLLDTLDLEFTPATEFVSAANVSFIELECDGHLAQLTFLSSPNSGVARFNVSGCNPDVADPTVSLLSIGALETTTRRSALVSNFPVSAPWFPRLTNDFCTTGNLLILQFDYPVVPTETSPLTVTSDCLKAEPIVARGVTDSRIFLKLAAPDTCTISFGIVTDVPARVNVYGDWCQPFAQSLPVGVESVYLMGTERLIVKLNRTFASIAELDASITDPASYYVACPAPSLYQSRVSRLIDYSSDTLRFAVEGCTNQTDATFITTSSYSRETYLPVIPTLQASVAETVSCVEQGSTVVSARISGEWELVAGAVTANSPCQVASVEAWDQDLVFEVTNVTEKAQCVLTANVSLLSVPGFYETIVFPLQSCVYSNELRPSGTFGGMSLGGQVAFTLIVTFGLLFGILLALAFLYPVCCLSRRSK